MDVVVDVGAGAGAEAAAGVLVGGAAGAEAVAAWAETLHWSNTKTAEAQRGLVIIVNILVISRNLCIVKLCQSADARSVKVSNRQMSISKYAKTAYLL